MIGHAAVSLVCSKESIHMHFPSEMKHVIPASCYVKVNVRACHSWIHLSGTRLGIQIGFNSVALCHLSQLNTEQNDAGGVYQGVTSEAEYASVTGFQARPSRFLLDTPFLI